MHCARPLAIVNLSGFYKIEHKLFYKISITYLTSIQENCMYIVLTCSVWIGSTCFLCEHTPVRYTELLESDLKSAVKQEQKVLAWTHTSEKHQCAEDWALRLQKSQSILSLTKIEEDYRFPRGCSLSNGGKWTFMDHFKNIFEFTDISSSLLVIFLISPRDIQGARTNTFTWSPDVRLKHFCLFKIHAAYASKSGLFRLCPFTSLSLPPTLK